MDPFPDFGLFELLAALGAMALARRVYARRWAPVVMLFASLVAPLILVFITSGEAARWLAALCLATALVNAGLVITLLRNGRLAELTARPQPETSAQK